MASRGKKKMKETKREHDIPSGQRLSYYSLYELEEKDGVRIDALPFTIRILLENLLRNLETKRSTEEDVLVHFVGAANHPSDSRVFGIYLPGVWDDPKYEEFMIAEATPWDDLVRIFVRGLDLRPKGFNWTTDRPSTLTFELRSIAGTSKSTGIGISTVCGTSDKRRPSSSKTR